jgi:hypothetical protein
LLKLDGTITIRIQQVEGPDQSQTLLLSILLILHKLMLVPVMLVPRCSKSCNHAADNKPVLLTCSPAAVQYESVTTASDMGTMKKTPMDKNEPKKRKLSQRRNQAGSMISG